MRMKSRLSCTSAVFVLGTLVVVACSTQTSRATLKASSQPGLVAQSAQPASARPAPAEGVNEIAKFLPEGFSVAKKQRGDVDADGDEDVLVVLQDSRDEEARFKPRTLKVLLRNERGELEETLSNPKAVLCSNCGGMVAEPLVDIRIDPQGFSLYYEGLSRVMWSQTYRFVHSSSKVDWMLTRLQSGVLDRINGESCKDQLGADDFGSISLREFDPAELETCSIP